MRVIAKARATRSARAFALAGVSGTVLLAGAACSLTQEHAPASRTAEISRVREVLRMEYPYRIRSWDYFLDGGTAGVEVRDRRGRKLEFSMDGRILDAEQPMPAYAPGDTIRVPLRHWFLGAIHPSRPGARELAIGGVEERAILDMLETISLDQFSREAITRVAAVRESVVFHETSRLHTEQARWALRAGCVAWRRRHADPAGQIVGVMPTLPGPRQVPMKR